jgi:hypothetical protein
VESALTAALSSQIEALGEYTEDVVMEPAAEVKSK